MGSKNILLIEDDYFVQTVHKSMIAKLGYHVDTASNGQTALDLAKSKDAYQIIFVDIGLPDISGYDVMTNLRKFYDETHTQNRPAFIAITGYSGKAEAQACLDAGACLVVNKPVVLNSMRDILAKYAPI